MSERQSKPSRLKRSNTTDQSTKESKEMNCKLAYQLQKNNKELHEAEFKRTKELLKHFSSFKSNLETWKEKWSSFYTNKQTELTEYQSIWHIFEASALSVGIYIDDITDQIEKLKDARKTIPELNEYDDFESKIKQARGKLDTLETQNKGLQKDNKNLEKQKKEAERPASQRPWNCIRTEREPIDLSQRQLSIDSQIKNMQSLIKKEKAAFCHQQKKLYEEFKQEEIKRWNMLKNQSQKLVDALSIDDEDFNQLLETYEAADDFENWNSRIFRPDSEKAEQSQSPGSKTVE